MHPGGGGGGACRRTPTLLCVIVSFFPLAKKTSQSRAFLAFKADGACWLVFVCGLYAVCLVGEWKGLSTANFRKVNWVIFPLDACHVAIGASYYAGTCWVRLLRSLIEKLYITEFVFITKWQYYWQYSCMQPVVTRTYIIIFDTRGTRCVS